MRDAFAEVLGELSEVRSDLFLVTADISPASALVRFVKNNPTRVIDAGVSEQVMIGICAGLAMEGFRPFAYTIASFSVFRPFEQLRVDLSYQNLPVIVMGVGAGLSYSALGGTHHSPEDIAIISTLPNFRIYTPVDPNEVKLAVKNALSYDGPSYIRLGKSGEPDLTSKLDEKYDFGICRLIHRGIGFDSLKIAIISYGPIVGWILESVKNNLIVRDVDIYAVTTISPLPEDSLNEIFEKYDKFIVIEEHYEILGLASMIKTKINASIWYGKLCQCGLSFNWSHTYGTQSDIRENLGLTTQKINHLLDGGNYGD